MNGKDLINAFDEITPTEAQKEKMLANVLSRRKTRNVIRIKKYCAAFVGAAAVLVLTIGYMNYGASPKDARNYAMTGSGESVSENTHNSVAEDIENANTSETTGTKTDVKAQTSVKPKPSGRIVAKTTGTSSPADKTEGVSSTSSGDKTHTGGDGAVKSAASGGRTIGERVRGGFDDMTDADALEEVTPAMYTEDDDVAAFVSEEPSDIYDEDESANKDESQGVDDFETNEIDVDNDKDEVDENLADGEINDDADETEVDTATDDIDDTDNAENE